MLPRFIEFFKSINVEALDVFADRIGLTSIFASLGLTVAQDIAVQPWAMTDYALMISCIGGVLFIIEKLILIYIRYRQSRKISQAEKQKKKSRNLPK